MIKTILVSLSIALSLTSLDCCFLWWTTTCQDHCDVSPKQFNLVDVPNERDKIGFVFAIDSNGNAFPIDQIEISDDESEGTVAFPHLTCKRSFSLELLANFLDSPQTDLTANTGYTSHDDVLVSFSMDGVRLSRVLLLKMDSAIQRERSTILSWVKAHPEEKLRFYMVVETYSARKMDFTFHGTQSSELALVANLRSLANTNNKIRWESDESKTLSYNLDSPLVVFYKAYPLTIVSGIGGPRDISIDHTPTILQNGLHFK
jgi:hypothetical protein